MAMENIDQWVIERIIEIDTTPDKVWRVFTDPGVTRYLGREYVTDWTVGGSFGWKGSDGTLLTRGTILQIEREKLLRHNLYDGANSNQVLSEITYKLQYSNEQTSLYAREDLNYEMTDSEYEEVSEGWDAALISIKKAAERL